MAHIQSDSLDAMKTSTPGVSRAALARRRQRVISQDSSTKNNTKPPNTRTKLPPRHNSSLKAASIDSTVSVNDESQKTGNRKSDIIPKNKTDTTPPIPNNNTAENGTNRDTVDVQTPSSVVRAYAKNNMPVPKHLISQPLKTENNKMTESVPLNEVTPNTSNRQSIDSPMMAVNNSGEDSDISKTDLDNSESRFSNVVKADEEFSAEPARDSSASPSGSEEEVLDSLQDEDIFEEEPEPLVPTNEDTMNATVLRNKALIMIKSYSDGQVLQLDESDQEKKAKMTSHLDAQAVEIHLPSGGDGVIRYGQSVAIYSTISKCYLGVKVNNKTDNDSITFDLGFFRGAISDVEQWTILHGNRQLLIGSAVRLAAKTAAKGNTMTVKAGEPLVLRNNILGGLLSFNPDNVDADHHAKKISLVTQSYRSDVNGSRDSLLDRALNHYQIYPSNHELFQLCFANTPPCPSWIYESTKICDSPCAIVNSNIEDKSRTEQERLLLDEVIASLIGMEGNVIRKVEDEFQISSEVNSSLRSLVERTLPIATGFCKVKSFLLRHQPGYEYGLVHQALCEEIDAILGEYLSSVEDLDKRFRKFECSARSTMNQSFIDIQRLSSIICLVQDVIEQGKDKIGGALLNALLNLKMTAVRGDYHKQVLINRLLEKASVPWMTMLTHWLAAGDLEDPIGEFMIDSKHANAAFSGDNWTSIFSIRPKHVFTGVISSVFLEEKVLMTGKYWNAVQHCEDVTFEKSFSEAEGPREEILRYDEEPSSVALMIEDAYKKASSHLLQLVLGHFAVERSLLTLKRYFLLDQGDFFVNFMDTAERELSRPLENVSRGRTQHWLSMALHLSESLSEEDVDDMRMTGSTPQPLTPNYIRCFFFDESLDEILGICESEPKTPSRHPYGQIDGLTGMLSFSLDFRNVPFPTSLLVSRQRLSKYQMLFRHIFYTKYIEKRLVNVWLENQMMKQYQEIRNSMGLTFCLRQRMLHFVQNFLYYMMLEVIEPNWIKMIQSIKEQETLDDVINLHEKFLQSTMEDCLLTNASLFKSLARTMSTCLSFSEQMKRFFLAINKTKDDKVARRRGDILNRRTNLDNMTRKERQAQKELKKQAILADQNEQASRHKRKVSIMERELNDGTYQRMIKRHAEVFDENLGDLMRKLKSKVALHSRLDNLCIRLDYNGYLSKQSS